MENIWFLIVNTSSFPKIESPRPFSRSVFIVILLWGSRVTSHSHSHIIFTVRSLSNHTQRRASSVRTMTFLVLNNLWHFYSNPTAELKICEACTTRSPLVENEGLWCQPTPLIRHKSPFPLWPAARWVISVRIIPQYLQMFLNKISRERNMPLVHFWGS